MGFDTRGVSRTVKNGGALISISLNTEDSSEVSNIFNTYRNTEKILWVQ